MTLVFVCVNARRSSYVQGAAMSKNEATGFAGKAAVNHTRPHVLFLRAAIRVSLTLVSLLRSRAARSHRSRSLLGVPYAAHTPRALVARRGGLPNAPRSSSTRPTARTARVEEERHSPSMS